MQTPSGYGFCDTSFYTMTSLLQVRQLVACLAFAVLAVGCSEMGPEADGPLTIRVVSGNQQEVPQGESLAAPVVVEVSNSAGDGVAGVPITVIPTKGDGRIEPGDRMTDSDGRVELQWRLGDDREHAMRLTLPDGQVSQTTMTAKTTFRYVPPEPIGDGWPTNALDPASSQAQAISDGVDAIRDGSYTKVHSLLVVHQGELVFETYFSGKNSQGTSITFDRDTEHEVQSSSKSFRSALMGIAIDQGVIDGVDQKIQALYPEHAALFTGTKTDITVEHILTMSSGIQWDEFTTASSNVLDAMYRLPLGQRPEFVLSQPMQYPPGSQWVYNTGASQMLESMIVNASGAPLQTFVAQYYTDLVEGPSVSEAYPFGGTILPRSMAKLGQVFLDDGMWKTTRVVSSEWVEQSIQPRFTVNGSLGYGYQWWSRSYSTSAGTFDAYYAAGNGGQYIIVVDDLELVAVFTGGHFGSNESETFHALLARYILPAFAS
ncbi:MAG: hypothetical protein Rubg2KO_23270 [Rubricoccaceae bacterium]